MGKTNLCRTECKFEASGTGAAPTQDQEKARKKKQKAAAAARSEAERKRQEELPPKELWDPDRQGSRDPSHKLGDPDPRASKPPAPATPPAPAPKKPPRKAAQNSGEKSGTAPQSPLSSVEQAIAILPKLSTLQLKWLGDAVLGELAKRAEAADSAA